MRAGKLRYGFRTAERSSDGNGRWEIVLPVEKTGHFLGLLYCYFLPTFILFFLLDIVLVSSQSRYSILKNRFESLSSSIANSALKVESYLHILTVYPEFIITENKVI
jgi:hypothetical protein